MIHLTLCVCIFFWNWVVFLCLTVCLFLCFGPEGWPRMTTPSSLCSSTPPANILPSSLPSPPLASSIWPSWLPSSYSLYSTYIGERCFCRFRSFHLLNIHLDLNLVNKPLRSLVFCKHLAPISKEPPPRKPTLSSNWPLVQTVGTCPNGDKWKPWHWLVKGTSVRSSHWYFSGTVSDWSTPLQWHRYHPTLTLHPCPQSLLGCARAQTLGRLRHLDELTK